MLAKAQVPATRKKVAIIDIHPEQNYAPLFQAVAKDATIDLRVFFISDYGAKEYFDPGFGRRVKWDIPLLEGYSYEVVNPGTERVPFWAPGSSVLLENLKRFDPDVVTLHGYACFLNWRAALWAKYGTRGRSRRIVFYSDSNIKTPRKRLPRLLKRILLPFLFRHVDCFVTASEGNEAYLKSYGADPRKFRRGVGPIDVSRFLEMNERSKELDIRRSLGIPQDAFVVLSVAKLIARKRPADLITAVARLAKKGSDIFLLMVGGGPLTDVMKNEAERMGLGQRIKFVGFKNQTELPPYFRASDVLALCSDSEAYGLVVPQACIFGVPVIVSDQCGCASPTDVARDGINGFVYPTGNVDRLAESIEKLLQDENLRARFSKAAEKIARDQDISNLAKIMAQAVE